MVCTRSSQMGNKTNHTNVKVKPRVIFSNPSSQKMKKPLVEENDYFMAKIDKFSDYQVIDNIKNKLTPRQTELFGKTCFGQFLNLPKIKFLGQLIHQILMRQLVGPSKDNDPVVFVIGGNECEFGLKDFALITGLDCSEFATFESSAFEDKMSNQFRKKFFKGKKNVLCKNIIACFESYSGESDDEAVKLAQLYLLVRVLLGKKLGNVCCEFILNLVDNADEFNKFPWGRYVYEGTVKSFRGALENSLREKSKHDISEAEYVISYTLSGFPLALQYWAFEFIPKIGDIYGKRIGRNIPRMLNWNSIKQPQAKILIRFFGSLKFRVESGLEPTETEMGADHFRYSLGKQIPKKRTRTHIVEDRLSNQPEESVENSKMSKCMNKSKNCGNKRHHKETTPTKAQTESSDDMKLEIKAMKEELKAMREEIGIYSCDLRGKIEDTKPEMKAMQEELKAIREEMHINTCEVREKFEEMKAINEKLKAMTEEMCINKAVIEKFMATVIDLLTKKPCNFTESGNGVVHTEDCEGKTIKDIIVEVMKQHLWGYNCVPGEALAETLTKKPCNHTESENNVVGTEDIEGHIPYKNTVPTKRKRSSLVKKDDIPCFTIDPLEPPCDAEKSEFDEWLKVGLKRNNRKTKYSDADNTLHPAFDFTVWKCDKKDWFFSLNETAEWLSSTHIDVALYYIRKKKKDHPGIFRQRSTTTDTIFQLILNTIYPKFKQDPKAFLWKKEQYPFQTVEGIEPLQSLPWVNVDFVYIPVNINGSHWTVAVLDLKNRKLNIYDSFHTGRCTKDVTSACLPMVKMLPWLMKSVGLFETRKDLEDLTSPLGLNIVRGVPQQENGGDCGMFMLKFTELLMQDRTLDDCNQHAVSFFRNKMAVELYVHGKKRMAKN